jgi:hypothetical protein
MSILNRVGEFLRRRVSYADPNPGIPTYAPAAVAERIPVIRAMGHQYGWAEFGVGDGHIPSLDEFRRSPAARRRAVRYMLSDEIVKAALTQKIAAVMQLDLQAKPADKTRLSDRNAAEFVHYCLTQKVDGQLRDVIWNIVHPALLEGVTVAELAWPAPGVLETKGKWRGKRCPVAVKARPPGSFEIIADEFDNVVGVRPLHAPGLEVVDPQDLIIFKWMSLFSSPFGMSDLEAAFKAWSSKLVCQRLQIIYFDRLVGPFLVATSPEPDDAGLKNDLAAARACGYIVLKSGAELDVKDLAGASGAAFETAIEGYNRAIAQAIVGSYLHMMESKITNARGDTQEHRGITELFEWDLSAAVSAVLSQQVGPKITAENFAGAGDPLLALADIDTAFAKAQLGLAMDAQQAGADISRKWVHDVTGVPAPDPDDPDDVLPGLQEAPPGPPGPPLDTPPPAADTGPAPAGGSPPGAGQGPFPGPPPALGLAAGGGDAEALCGGKGSGRPGPCPDPSKARSRYRPRGGKGPDNKGQHSPVLPTHKGTGKAVPTAGGKGEPAPAPVAPAGKDGGNGIGQKIAGWKDGDAMVKNLADQHAAVEKAAAAKAEAVQGHRDLLKAHDEATDRMYKAVGEGDKKGEAAARKDMAALGKQKAAAGKAADRATAEHANAQESARQAVLTHAAVPEGERAGVRAESRLEGPPEAARQQGEGFVGKLLRGDAPIKPAYVAAPEGERSHYAGEGTTNAIVRLNGTDPAVTAHELGHLIEDRVPGVHQAALDFLDHRVGAEPAVKMAEKFGPAYQPDETGRKDSFDKALSPERAYYAGKDYGGKATEIVSVGVEELYRDGAAFAAKDPEYCKFILGVLHGPLRGGGK